MERALKNNSQGHMTKKYHVFFIYLESHFLLVSCYKVVKNLKSGFIIQRIWKIRSGPQIIGCKEQFFMQKNCVAEDTHPIDNLEPCISEGGAVVQQQATPVEPQNQPSTTPASLSLSAPTVINTPTYHHTPTYLPQYQPYHVPPQYNQPMALYDHNPGVQTPHYPPNHSVHVQNSRSHFQS